MLVASLLPIQAWAAPPGDRTGVQLPGLQEDLKAKLDQVEAAKLEGWAGAPAQPPAGYEPSKVTPPAAGTASVALSGDQLVQAGSLPVSIGKASPTESNPAPPTPSGTWSVAVEARTATEAANVDGALIKVTPPADAPTPVDVQLDYKQFKDLFGTEWSSRLELKMFPECFLSTPDLPECSTAQAVPSTNDPATGTVRATVDPATAPGQGMRTMAVGGGPMLLAASDSASGAGGTYTATPLAASASWSAGGSSGGFSWTYPLGIPAPAAGPAPKIDFTYSSQSVDGKTSVANSQASWIGDGWDYTPGFIERRYRTCSDDLKATPSQPNNDNATDKKKGDLCWAGDNMVMSLGGNSTELVRDAATGQWVPAGDDGSRVERKTDTAIANGAKDGEYWVVTTPNGTRYFFGRHDVDGAGTRAVTDSVFTVPVFGNHAGEPCHQAAFADSSCQQAWRWNLDYVEDIHGNAMVIDWKKETNHYAKNDKTTTKAAYTRGGYPSQISYGLRADNLSGAPGAKVEFTVEERCIKEGTAKCSDTEFESKNYSDKQPWWDTPSTLHCKADAKECFSTAPSFWTRKRLTAVTTYAQRTEGSTALSLVDRWTLAQSFPKQRTDTHPPLWLESITRTGFGTAKDSAGNQLSTSLPPVSFLANVQDMPNRVATGTNDPTPDFDRLRVETIRSETGGEIYVDYSDPCPLGTTRPKPEENTSRCYPVHWSPDSEAETPPIAWFNKYVVDRVVEKDRVARQPDQVTTYTYEGDAAWAKDSDEFTKPELRTYNMWRGYASVMVKSGTTANAGKADATEETQSRTRYFRGMSGDAGRAKVTVKDSTGNETLGEDLPHYQGRTAEEITYSKAGGTVDKRVLNWPWSQKTATRPRDGTTPLEAYRINTARTDTIQPISGGRVRVGRSLNTFEPTYGLLQSAQTEARTEGGSTGSVLVEQNCTVTTYVHNTAAYLIGLPQRVRVTAGECSQAASAAMLSDLRTSYDALNAFGTAPVKGLPFQVDSADATGTGWVTTARTEYDSLGRTVKVQDASGNATTTTFTPATGVPFSTKTTNPLGHSSTVKADPGRGSAVQATDANGRKTTVAYDNLGRTTGVWTPSQKTTDKPAQAYEYRIEEHQAPVVTSKTLRDNDTYATSVAIHDGRLRPRQTQAEAVGGGRLVTDTFYNANGTVRQTNNAYAAEGSPDGKIFVPESVYQVPNSTKTAYDGLGRPVRTTTLHADVAQNSTTNEYGGDWALSRTGMSADGTTPLPGSRAAKTWTDGAGRTTLIQHYTATDLTTSTDTKYTYNQRGKLATVTDAAGNKWAYAYDGRGRMTSSDDPDTGKSTFTYNNLDQKVSTTDSSGRTQFTTYDVLGRATELRDNAADGPLIASWTFDSLPGAKGLPVASTRFEGIAAFKSEVTGYDTEYRPTGTKTTIPEVPSTKGLAGTYAYTTTYTPRGQVQSTTVPATPGGLAAEKLITRYDAEGMAKSFSGLSWYTSDVVYSPYGQVLRTASGNAPNRVWTTTLYNRNTSRVEQSISDRETANPNRISALSYTYDTVGNPTSITDTQAGGRVDRQCFTYDAMGQLTKAWTAKSPNCPAPSTTEVTAGPDGDGYWYEYQFDAIGNRTKLIDRDLTNGALDDETKYTYGVPVAGNGTQPPTTTQPHALTKAEKTTRTATSTVNSLSAYEYDAAGNTKSRRIGGDTQTLNWDRRNKLVSASSPGIGAVSVIGLSGKCLDVEGGSTADGTRVQLWSCKNVKAQQWRLTDNTVRALGKCLTADNGQAHITACDGSDKQKFVYRPGDKTLYNQAANACVDVPGGDTTDGTDLLVYTCNGGTNQQWTFDSTTTYLYDASGNRLIEETATTRTLYLGEAVVTVDKAGQAIDAVRYYSGPGGVTTRRTDGKGTGHKLSFLLSDHHNTATASIDQAAGQQVTRRKFDPYGNVRGAEAGNWPGDRTFLGTGVDDSSTGLTHIGAREYDPSTGRFISVDPVIDITDPLQMNGYTYSNGNPITNWDPSGLALEECASGMYTCTNRGTKPTGTGKNYDRIVTENKAVQRQHSINRQYAAHYGWGVAGQAQQSYDRAVKMDAAGKKPIRDTTNTAKAELRKMLVKYDPNSGDVSKQVAYKMYMFGASIEEVEYFSSHYCDFLSCNTPVEALLSGRNVDSPLYEAPASELIGQAFGAGLASRIGTAPIAGKARWKPCANSFVAGTLVQMADGSTKPIEELTSDDVVLATNPETGETAARNVTATIYTKDDKSYVDITAATPEGAANITATGHHPFWSESEHAWLNADQLRPGMTLRTDNGATVPVTATRTYTGINETYNLTVADLHTYYVLAGETPVLVHNCGGSLYEAGGKHGATARSSSRGINSAEPQNGQAALDNSVPVKGTSPRRVGADVENGEIVVLDRTVQRPCECGGGGTNDIYHGHVRSWDDLHIDMQNALRRAGLVDRRGRIVG
ncbi:ricin-type beta-trefoil lectin domain protein [Streptomyces sp. BR123]|uniref:ricin-type beta-trefoil lectin domain protein n=1 Tax=Streptomyces sp. BR123 TaxID=2749828 RepID=UPI0015C496E3|nr:ricin-type beta-trefoil lectin domain protein [Streptomyces sp. BR123]NXY96974.1 ricin-type beta-trefoil lectin domain protein [Streptomyces sp. BR123]